ncbi:MAG: hypothetical protein II688_07055 [Lachnospiraceae bacterium]|nr:hypothetical protein [Lachnospiraceae bacterium]MBQ3968428.1 hypothetical protein [Lachnospiraceae bacterium]
MRKKSFFGIPALLTACMICTGASASDEEWLVPKGAEPESITAEIKDLKESRLVGARVRSKIEELCFYSPGEVEWVNCQIGEEVSKYQMLAKVSRKAQEEKVQKCLDDIEEAEEKARLESGITDAKIEEAKKELALYESKVEAGTADNYTLMMYELTQLDLDSLEKEKEEADKRTEIELARLEEAYDAANAMMTYDHIYSPCDGTVIFCGIEKGGTVLENEYVIAVKDGAEKYIESFDTGIGSLREAKKYEAFYAVIDGEKYEITYENGPLDEGSRAVFSFPEEAKDTMSSEILIEMVIKENKDVLVLPLCCIYHNGNTEYVYRIKDGRREMVEVMTGDDNGAEVIITAGDIKEGDEIYVP